MTIKEPKLPFAYDALEPHISKRTLQLHYGKHHLGYFKKLKDAIDGSAMQEWTLEKLIQKTSGDIYNLAAQVWNHSFYWNSLTPEATAPSDALAIRLTKHFGGINSFKQELAKAAKGEFGSGWAWLVESIDGDLTVLSSSDADNPISQGQRPLLTLDVWEHAYYLDYQNERGSYIDAILGHCLNWQFLESNLR